MNPHEEIEQLKAHVAELQATVALLIEVATGEKHRSEPDVDERLRAFGMKWG